VTPLSSIAEHKGIRYFLISFSDLRGVQRAKLVPAASIDKIAAEGAGFAGFATWLDMTPADPDMFAIADPKSLIRSTKPCERPTWRRSCSEAGSFTPATPSLPRQYTISSGQATKAGLEFQRRRCDASSHEPRYGMTCVSAPR